MTLPGCLPPPLLLASRLSLLLRHDPVQHLGQQLEAPLHELPPLLLVLLLPFLLVLLFLLTLRLFLVLLTLLGCQCLLAALALLLAVEPPCLSLGLSPPLPFGVFTPEPTDL